MKHLVMILCVIVLSVMSISAVKGECGGACIIDNFIKLTKPEEINKFIAGGADVNTRDSTGQTALMMFARKHKKPETIQALIDAGADVNARTKNGRTALEYAVRNYKDLAVAKILMQAGANPSLLDTSSKRTLLASVFRAKDTDTLQAMLAAGLDVNEKDDYSDPVLFRAVDGVNHDMVKLLLKAGADVNARGSRGTALYEAVIGRSPEILQTLIEAGADVNVRGGSLNLRALGYAVRNHKDLAIAKLLLKAGANPSLLSGMWKSKLLGSVFRTNDTDALRAMIAAGFDVNEKDSGGATVLHRAAGGASPEMVKVLLETGADVNARTGRGRTALDRVVGKNRDLEAKDLALAKLLLKAGTDLALLNERNRAKLLSLVVQDNDIEMLQAMIDAGLNMDATFRYVVNVTNSNMVKFLLKAGADVDAHDAKGKTALMTAAAYRAGEGSAEVLQILIDAGANVHARNNNGDTALEYTIHRSRVRFDVDTAKAAMLLKAGLDLSLLSIDEKTGLLKAVVRGKDAQTFRAMIDAGLDINENRIYGIRAWRFALNEIQDPETLQAFIDAGLNVVKVRDEFGNTVLHLVKLGKTDEWRIRVLLKAGADIMASNDKEEIVLHRLVKKIREPKTIQAIINAAGPDITAKDGYGRTALHVAAGNNKNMVKALVDAGLDVNARDDFKDTVLMYAADSRGDPEIFETLIDAGADANAFDKSGRTALHRVIYNHREDKFVEHDRALLTRRTNMAKVLLKAGADINARAADGNTPLFYAVAVHNKPMIEAFIKAGADVNAIRKGKVRTVLAFALRGLDRSLAKTLLKAGADISLLDQDEREILNRLGLQAYQKS